jgi:hypothetical protein
MASNQDVAQHLQDRDFSVKMRKSMDLSDFGDPSKRAFPVLNQSDLDNAARLIGHADNPEAVKRRLIAIAKRKGLKLPDAWQDGDKKKENGGKEEKQPAAVSSESVSSAFSSASRSGRVATITTTWLEDDAISLNGRQYPREAVDKLVQSAQLQLSDPGALPLTCYLSHDDADQDRTRDLVGRITKVWREGNKAYASIDIPGTTAGRDVVTLVEGKYINSLSLRATNAEMKIDKNRTFPQVGGANLQLLGIDFTTSPGLPAVARITNLALAESHNSGELVEVFNAHSTNFNLLLEDKQEPGQEKGSPMEDVTEAGLAPLSGEAPYMDGSTADADGYAARNMPVPQFSDQSEVSGAQLPDNALAATTADHGNSVAAGDSTMHEGMRAVHDHMARVLDAHLGSAHGGSQEAAGKRLAKHQLSRLVDAHDTAARHLGMACEGAYNSMMNKPDNSAGNDGMQDGDDDDAKESTTKETAQAKPQAVKEVKRMTPQEAAQLLKEAGYKVQPPPTREEILRSQFAAQLAEQKRQNDEQLAEMKKLLEAVTTTVQQAQQEKPQRKSLVEGSQLEPLPQAKQRRTTYIQEQIQSLNPHEIIDRSRPLPDWLAQNPERALREFQKAYLGMVFDRYGWPDGVY